MWLIVMSQMLYPQYGMFFRKELPHRPYPREVGLSFLNKNKFTNICLNIYCSCVPLVFAADLDLICLVSALAH